MKILFDTSAMAKRYKREAGHEAVSALLMDADAVVLAAHCKVEIASSFSREMHDAQIDLGQYDHAMDEVAQDFVDFQVLAINAQIEGLSMAAMRHTRLRAMDALHIATAQVAGVDLFVTADRRQAAAAQATGLKTQLVNA